MLINSKHNDLDMDSKILNSDNYMRQKKARHVSEFNRVRIQQNELSKINNSFFKSQDQDIREVSTQGTNEWNTTNQEFYQAKDLNELGLQKRNFKRKTPFTQWSNAYFGNGVFFNPPVQGI